MYYSTAYLSPVGFMSLASDGHSLVGLWFEGQKYYGDTLAEAMVEKEARVEKGDIPVLNKTKKWLDRYFVGKKPLISELPLAPIGSEFRQRVWRILCEIPYGKTTTYGDIAKKIAAQRNLKNMSSQAVGGAVGHNPVSVIIPCHRVVGSNGNLTGYAAGIETKIKLLELEAVDMSPLFVPAKGTAL